MVVLPHPDTIDLKNTLLKQNLIKVWYLVLVFFLSGFWKTLSYLPTIDVLHQIFAYRVL